MINVAFSDCLSGCLHYTENNEIQDLRENILSLNLCLDFGDISELPFGKKRENDFVTMYDNDDIALASKWFKSEVKKINKIKKLVKQGHGIRIWYTEKAEEYCGFCWLLSVLDLLGVENNKILFVKLPQSILFDNGKYEFFGGSGMFDPIVLSRLAMNQRYLSDSYKNYHIRRWQELQKENAEMRVSINGQLVSVSADFYDSVIMAEIDKLDDTFKQATVIGKCIVKLSVNDSFLAWRIDKMIEKGLFEIVEEAPEDSHYYCRLLKKIR